MVVVGGAFSPDAHRVLFLSKGVNMKIGICAGHGRLGAEEPRLWEIERCLPALSTAFRMLKEAKLEVYTPSSKLYDLENDDALIEKVKFFNNEKVDLSIEIHINAGGGNYSTCLYWDKKGTGKFSAVGKAVAEEIEEQFDNVTPWRSNGAKGQSSYGRSLYFLNKTNHPSVITEIGFKDYSEHRDWLLEPSSEVLHGSAIAQAIILHSQRS